MVQQFLDPLPWRSAWSITPQQLGAYLVVAESSTPQIPQMSVPQGKMIHRASCRNSRSFTMKANVWLPAPWKGSPVRQPQRVRSTITSACCGNVSPDRDNAEDLEEERTWSSFLFAGSKHLPSSLFAIIDQFPVFAFKVFHHLFGFLDGGREFVPFLLPASNAFPFCVGTAFFRFDLEAQSTLFFDRHSLHHKFHATCLSGPILLVTVLSEVAPFVVATGEKMLVVKAHVV